MVPLIPASPPEATSITLCMYALHRVVDARAVVRVRCGFQPSPWSVPAPDVAVVPGTPDDYWDHHPSTALLLVEVADRTLAPDRLSKSRIYAAAKVPEYWIVNLRDRVIEVMQDPDAGAALYREKRVATPGDELELAALPGGRMAVAELLPKRR